MPDHPLRRAYLAGPMRGIPEFNAPAFRAATDQLRAAGYDVYSPVELNDRLGRDFTGAAGTDAETAASGFDLRGAMEAELAWILRHADVIVVLPGWENSRGANAETAVGRAIGLPIWDLQDALVIGADHS